MAKQWRIGITDHVVAPADIERTAFPEAEFHFLEDWRTGEDAAALWRQMDAILVWHWAVDEATLGVLDQCKVVVRYGVGYDAIDLPALAARGIPLCNTPDYGTEEVCDTACAMILAIQRQLVAYDRLCRTFGEGWQEHALPAQQRTNCQTLGVIGVGRIGTAVVNRMKPFGYRILGYDPYVPSGHEKAIGYERVGSLDALLAESDIITIHCPLSNETLGMVDAEFLGKMKPGASLVNTARGRIIMGLGCLEAALRTERLAYVYLDVLPDEPPKPHSLLDAWRNDEPWLRGRLVINPHTAYFSQQGWHEMRFKAAETARMALLDGTLRNHITH
ncbi:C-terminal binding protein [bacterium]|nr:C-terminal binding protein [bacterium]